MATERVSDRQIEYPIADRSLARIWHRIKANRYSIYSAFILAALVCGGFVFRGFV